jgi:hypothetical protein
MTGDYKVIYCSSCGKRADPVMKFCPSCGQKLESNVFRLDELSEPPDEKGPRAGIIAVQKHAGGAEVEKAAPVYYSDENGVCVTPSLLVIPGKKGDESPSTYALADITSVKSEKDITARIIGCVGVVFGVVLILARNYTNLSTAVGVGTALIILGALIAIFIRPVYHLKIIGPHGEIDALKTSRKKEFDCVMLAVNQAIGSRE